MPQNPSTYLGRAIGRVKRAIGFAMAGLAAAAGALAPMAPVAAEEPVDEGAYAELERTPFPILSGVGGARDVALSGQAVIGRSGVYVELPTRSVVEWTPGDVRAALLDADTGMMRRPALLVEAIMGDDRVQGVLSTRTHGLLGLPVSFYGDPDLVALLQGVKALGDQPAVPGDWAAMFPEAELAKLVSWGILLGVGLAERVPCEGRELGEREVPAIKIWHPQFLRWQWDIDQWFLMTSEGEIPIDPGDRRWILYMPYGEHRPWAYGAWRPIAFAWVLKQFALHDRARHSEVCGSPARVGTAPQASSEPMRQRWLRDIRKMGRDNAVVLEEGYTLELVESVGQTWKIYEDQIEWADRAIAITLAGQAVTTEGTSGFSNGNIHAAIKQDLIQFTATSLSTCLFGQALVWWAADNFEGPVIAPHPQWDTAPPVDKEKLAQAYKALGDGLTAILAAAAQAGITKKPDVIGIFAKFSIPMIDGVATLPELPGPKALPAPAPTGAA